MPFTSGHYSTAPGLKLADSESLAQDQLIFQLDEQYSHYLHNKQTCRNEDINKYYLEADLPDATIRTVNNYILNQLLKEHSAYFSRSGTTFFNRLKKEARLS